MSYLYTLKIIFLETFKNTAAAFHKTTKDVNKRMWWKDMRWRIIIAAAVLIILVAIIGKVLRLSCEIS